MVARARYEEAIRLYVETAGDAELAQLVQQFQSLGAVADTEAAGAERALQGLADTAAALAKVDAFRKLKEDLSGTEAALTQAQAGAQALFAQFGDADKSSAAVVRLQKAARKSVQDLTRSAEQQRAALQAARQELAAAGIDTKQLGSAQAALNKQLASGRAALNGELDAIRKLRTEEQAAAAAADALKKRLSEQDAEFRRANLAKRAAADALEAYRKRAAAAAEASARLRTESSGVEGVFSRLRGVAAGAAAFLGFQGAKQGVINLLQVAAAAEDSRRALSNLYGSQAEGNRAFEALKQIADRSGLSMAVLSESAKKLKAFGLDPLNGSLQALIDQNAAVGGSQEDLSGKVLALGQAWAKQKLQGEEILQLVERGVPVWDALEKATGKNRAELQKLSEQGALGRDVIRKLYEEIGKANAGAAERSLNSLSGLFAQLTARWESFQQKIAEAGLADFFRREVDSLLGSTRNTESVAKRVSDAIIGAYQTLKQLAQQFAPLAQSLANFTSAVVKNAEAAGQLIRIWAAFKIANLAVGFAQGAQAALQFEGALGGVAAAASKANGPLGALRGGLNALPKNIQIAIAIAGIEFALRQADRLGKAIIEYQQVQANALEFGARQTLLDQQRLQLGQQLQALYRDYASQVVQSGETVSRMTQAQAQDYQFALDSARKYYEGVIRVSRDAGNAQAEATARTRWDELGVALDGVRQRLADISAEAAKTEAFNAFANNATEKFDAIVRSGQSAKAAVSGIFEGLNLASEAGLQKAVNLFDQIAARGKDAKAAIGDELRAAIAAVADEDMPRLQEAAQQAFKAGSQGAAELAAALDSINLTRLGVDIEAIKTGFTEIGRVAVDQFGRAVGEVKKLGLSAQQQSAAIAQAFKGAFKQLSTGTEIRALQTSLREAASAGTISAQEYSAALAESQQRMDELAGSGKSMGDAVAGGADHGREALYAMGEQAKETRREVAGVGDDGEAAGEKAAGGMKQASTEARALTASISGVSQEMIDLLPKVNNFELGQRFFKQLGELNTLTDILSKQLDELQGKTDALGDGFGAFNLVSEDQVRAVRDLANEIEAKRKEQQAAYLTELQAATEEYKRQLQAQKAANDAASTATGVSEPIVVELRGVGTAGSLDGLSDAEVNRLAARLAGPIASPLLQRLQRARANSNLVVRARR